jgi:hypothetical protein
LPCKFVGLLDFQLVLKQKLFVVCKERSEN